MWCANQEQGIDIVTPGGLIFKGFSVLLLSKTKIQRAKKEKSFRQKNTKNGVKVNSVINQELF